MFNHTRFLIVRLSSIGDILHTTTVARALKHTYPQCHITWIVSRTGAELLTCNPDIDELFVWSREEFEAALYSRQVAKAWACIQKLRDFFSDHSFDIALDIHGLFMSGVITRMSGAPRRIGMANTRELNHLFMTELAPPVSSPHMIKRYLSVLEPLAATVPDYQLVLKLPPALDGFAEAFLHRHGLGSGRKILLVNPWTSWPDKNWGIDRYAACINDLPEEIDIMICGGPGDRDNNAAIVHLLHRQVTDITGETTLLELAALLQKIDLLLTGDTGTLHIATALQVQTLSLWGPTRPEKYGPLVSGHAFICSENDCCNCNKTRCRYQTNACMNAIAPDIVSKKIIELLAAETT